MKSQSEFYHHQAAKRYVFEEKPKETPRKAGPDLVHRQDRKISVGSFICDSNGPGKTIYVETVPEQELNQRETPKPVEVKDFWQNRNIFDLFLKVAKQKK